MEAEQEYIINLNQAETYSWSFNKIYIKYII